MAWKEFKGDVPTTPLEQSSMTPAPQEKMNIQEETASANNIGNWKEVKEDINITPISQISQESQQNPQQEGLLPWAARQALGGLKKFAEPFENLLSIPDQASEHLLSQLPGSKPFLDQRQQVKELTEQQAKEIAPQNAGEEIVQETLAAVPWYMLSGGTLGAKPLASFLGSTAAAKAISKGLKKMGVGEIGQLAAEIGTPAMLKMLNPRNMMQYFAPKRHELYTKAFEAGKGKTMDAPQLKNTLKSLIEESYDFETPARKSLRKPLESIYNKMWGNNIDLNDLTGAKKAVNELIYDANIPIPAHNRLKKIESTLQKTLKEAYKKHPKFGEYQQGADALGKGMSKLNSASNFMDKLDLKQFANKPIGTLLGIGISKAEKPLEALGNFMVRSPKEYFKYSNKMLEGALKERPQEVMRALENMNKLLRPKKI